MVGADRYATLKWWGVPTVPASRPLHSTDARRTACPSNQKLPNKLRFCLSCRLVRQYGLDNLTRPRYLYCWSKCRSPACESNFVALSETETLCLLLTSQFSSPASSERILGRNKKIGNHTNLTNHANLPTSQPPTNCRATLSPAHYATTEHASTYEVAPEQKKNETIAAPS